MTVPNVEAGDVELCRDRGHLVRIGNHRVLPAPLGQLGRLEATASDQTTTQNAELDEVDMNRMGISRPVPELPLFRGSDAWRLGDGIVPELDGTAVPTVDTQDCGLRAEEYSALSALRGGAFGYPYIAASGKTTKEKCCLRTIGFLVTWYSS